MKPRKARKWKMWGTAARWKLPVIRNEKLSLPTTRPWSDPFPVEVREILPKRRKR